MTPTYLRELLESFSHAIDGMKFAGGAFAVHTKPALKDLIDIAHQHDVYVSTGGWIEHVLRQGKPAVRQYLKLCKEYGLWTLWK